MWRNKKDRIKRQALYQPLAKGGLSFPCFRTAVKALRLSWIGRILSDSNDNWKAIPNHYLEKHGGLSFLLKCNYDIKYLDNRLPSFYRELLRFFHELRSQYESPLKRDFILWNNKEILIDKKPVFWKPWYDKKIFFIKDLLTDSGDFLSFNQFKEKYNIETNFLQYYQMISAIPSILKQKSAEQGDSQMNKLSTKNTFFLSENKLINFDEFRCKQYYELFIESSACVPTAISSWGKNHPVIANSWESAVASTYKITSDNKLRQFSFKLLHRVLVTKKELKIFGIANDEKCEMCNELDSIEHTFLDCPEFLKLLDASLQWFNNRHSTVLTISPYDVILNQVPTSLQLSLHLKKKLRLLLLLVKHYFYTCKALQTSVNCYEFFRKLTLQFKVEKLL